MPDLELGPNDYRAKGPDGRWRIPDDPKLCRNVFFATLGILGFIYWNRLGVTPDNLFWITAAFAFCAGGLFSQWLKNVY